MHIPDGFVTAPVAAAGWALSAGGVGYAVRRTGRELKEKQVPLMGVLAEYRQILIQTLPLKEVLLVLEEVQFQEGCPR